MIPRVVHHIWLGGDLPERIRRMMQTIDAHNPKIGWLLWRDTEMRSLGLHSDRLREEFGTWAAASNFVRLLILQRHGGLYLDSDFECLKPLDGLFQLSAAPSSCGYALAAEQDGGRICNAFMAATPNHPWINWQLANRARYDQRDAASGVYLATDAPRAGLTLVAQHLVYPFLYDAPPEQRVPHVDSVLVHHWDGSWSKK